MTEKIALRAEIKALNQEKHDLIRRLDALESLISTKKGELLLLKQGDK